MAIDFPNTPAVDDTFTVSGKTWIWTGSVWNTVTSSTLQGTNGSQGVQGFAGTIIPASSSNIANNIVQRDSAGSFVATDVTVTNLYAGPSAVTAGLSNPVIVAKDTGSTYVQIAMVNSASTGSADFAAYGDNGSDSAGWVDMGFTGSGFNDTAYTITGKNDGYVFVQAVAGTGLTGNLVLATGGNGTSNAIIFGTGGFAAANEDMRLDGSGNLGIGGISTGSKLYVAGTIESTSGGIKFPDGTTQTSAASGGDLQYLTTVYR